MQKEKIVRNFSSFIIGEIDIESFLLPCEFKGIDGLALEVTVHMTCKGLQMFMGSYVVRLECYFWSEPSSVYVNGENSGKTMHEQV